MFVAFVDNNCDRPYHKFVGIFSTYKQARQALFDFLIREELLVTSDNMLEEPLAKVCSRYGKNYSRVEKPNSWSCWIKETTPDQEYFEELEEKCFDDCKDTDDEADFQEHRDIARVYEKYVNYINFDKVDKKFSRF
jgi:hypothetical protein